MRAPMGEYIVKIRPVVISTRRAWQSGLETEGFASGSTTD